MKIMISFYWSINTNRMMFYSMASHFGIDYLFYSIPITFWDWSFILFNPNQLIGNSVIGMSGYSALMLKWLIGSRWNTRFQVEPEIGI